MGDDDKALECYNEAIANDDTMARVYLGRGKQYLKRGDDQAREWMTQVIECDNYNYEVYFDAACLYALMGDVDYALQLLEYALYLDMRSKAQIEDNHDLDPIRNTEEFKQLIEQYF